MFGCLPAQCDLHTYKQAVALGDTLMSKAAVMQVSVRYNEVLGLSAAARGYCKAVSDQDGSLSQRPIVANRIQQLVQRSFFFSVTP